MKYNAYRIFLSILLFFSFAARAQDTLKINRAQCETIFLKENLALMAEKLKIPQAEAMVLQAKLWPNPTLTIDQVNLWATPSQTRGQEVVPPLIGSFGKNLEFGVGLEQLVQTAGKRKKLVALEQVSIEKAKQYFEELLRNLKIEFRNQLTNLQYLQFSQAIYQNQVQSVRQLAKAYQNQVDQGNVPKGEYVRLKALELEILKNISELKNEINEAQKEIKLLMHLPATACLEITDEGYWKNTAQFQLVSMDHLLSLAKESRPDFKLASLEQSFSSKLYAYEKARRTPDLNLKAAYDRNGSTMLNFVGFGVAMDLPVFNRNQGNIQSARIGMEQSSVLVQQKNQELENVVVRAYRNLDNAIQFFSQIEPGYEQMLDELLGTYTKNFTDRNISLLEYLDFMDAYLGNKKIILEAEKNVNEKSEELNYTVGKDVI